MQIKTLLALSLFTAPLVGCSVQAGSVGSRSSALGTVTPLIAQIYGGGGNSGEVFKNDYLVLYNPTNAAFSLDGYSVYVNNGGSTTSFTEFALPTSGSIASGGAYLIWGSAGSDGVALPTADATDTSLDILDGNGTAALGLSGSAATITVTNLDLVGWGTTDAKEGTAAPSMTTAKALVRNSSSGTCTNAGDNATDFTLTTLSSTTPPPNSSATITSCSSFETSMPDLSTSPDLTTAGSTDGAVGPGADDGASGPVDMATAPVTINDAGAEPTGNQPSATNGTGPVYSPGGTINGANTASEGRGFNGGCNVGGDPASTPWFAGLLVAGLALTIRRRRTA